MNKINRKVVLLLLAFGLSFSVMPSVNAAYTPYSEVFTGAIDATTRWSSPIENSSGSQIWPTVTSKWSEPRNVDGTSPHVGVDLSISTSKIIVAVADGTLKNLKDSLNTVSLETASGVYCHYEHMVVATTTYPDGTYAEGDRIGTGGSVGAAAEHLHFGAYSKNEIAGRKAYRTETLYRDTASWNYGRNLDVFSQAKFLSSKIAQITVVFSGTGNTHTEVPSAVTLFYRTAGSSNWIQGGAMQRIGTTFDYKFDFQNVVPTGTNIQWMARITRNLGITYPYAWAPAKYYRPDTNPNSTSNAYGYFPNTVTY